MLLNYFHHIGKQQEGALCESRMDTIDSCASSSSSIYGEQNDDTEIEQRPTHLRENLGLKYEHATRPAKAYNKQTAGEEKGESDDISSKHNERGKVCCRRYAVHQS